MGDWSSTTYIFSQVFTILAFASIGLTYLVKKRGHILITAICCNLFMGIGFMLLGAWAGGGYVQSLSAVM